VVCAVARSLFFALCVYSKQLRLTILKLVKGVYNGLVGFVQIVELYYASKIHTSDFFDAFYPNEHVFRVQFQFLEVVIISAKDSDHSSVLVVRLGCLGIIAQK
jgi:hypothetical protein